MKAEAGDRSGAPPALADGATILGGAMGWLALLGVLAAVSVDCVAYARVGPADGHTLWRAREHWLFDAGWGTGGLAGPAMLTLAALAAVLWLAAVLHVASCLVLSRRLTTPDRVIVLALAPLLAMAYWYVLAPWLAAALTLPATLGL